MKLLVSVRNRAEALAAIEGGADLIDAKEPLNGALGAVSPDVLHAIVHAVNGRKPVSAALGDIASAERLAHEAGVFARQGATLVKIGFAGAADLGLAKALISAAARAAGPPAVIAVGYADHAPANAPAAGDVVELAASAGIGGVLIDTADKNGPGLVRLAAPETLRAWVDCAHRAGLLVALAGQLTAGDLPAMRDLGADVVGVRGAACDGGRSGVVSAHRVQSLRAILNPARHPLRAARERAG